MLDGIRLQLVESFESVEMRECFLVPLEIIIDSELLPERLHVMQILEVRQILSGVFLRLLRNE